MAEQPARLFTIEALRGLASLGVAWFHLTNTYPNDVVRLSGAYGWLGVEVFFVISGFIIPYSLYAANYRVINFPIFILKRLVRLEPPYLLSIIFVVALAYASALAPQFRGEAPHYSLAQIASHFLYLVPFTPYGWVNVVYWTLFYEFLFYLAVGLFFPVIARANIVCVCLSFALIFGAICLVTEPPTITLLFLLGIAGFRYHTGRDSAAIIISMIATICAVQILSGELSAAVVGTTTLICILFVRLPEFPFLSFLGAISYSLYLTHVPLGGRIINLGRRFGSSVPFEMTLSLIALATSIAFAALYWRWVELPAHRASKRILLHRQEKPAASAVSN